MKQKIFFLLIALFAITILQAQSVFGMWKTIDDNTGIAKSYVEIYEKNGKTFGIIKEIFNPEARDNKCTECDGDEKNQPLIGFNVIKDMKKKGDEYTGGTITDPENGKIYKSKIWLNEDDPNRLKVRGYIAFIYRTQEWIRVEDGE